MSGHSRGLASSRGSSSQQARVDKQGVTRLDRDDEREANTWYDVEQVAFRRRVAAGNDSLYLCKVPRVWKAVCAPSPVYI